MILQAFEEALQLRTRDDAQYIYEAPRKLIDDAPIADSQPIERTAGRQLSLLSAGAQLPQRDVLAARDLAARFAPRLLPARMAGQYQVFPYLSVHGQHDADGLAVAGKQQRFLASLHILQQGRGLLTKLTDADDAHRDHRRDSTPWTGALQGPQLQSAET